MAPTRTSRRPATKATPRTRARAVTLAPEGIGVVIAAVTGTVDDVGDIIAPGAFTRTMGVRRAKLCWAHDWKDPLGRVLHVEEWMPGDKRLPAKLPDGRRWPTEAGALVATVQFHMDTTRGRDMFEHARQWGIAGEAAFSIGYRVVPEKTSKRADGVRIIRDLDLYEISLVLFGAHPFAVGLEFKSTPATDGAPQMEFKDGPAGAIDTQPTLGEGSAMLALYPSEEAAAQIAQEGGTAPEDLHITIALLGPSADIDGEALAGQLAPALADVGALSGTVAGLGMFPEGDDGTPVWAPVDVPGLDTLRSLAVTALDAAGSPQQSEHGYTPHMTIGYDMETVEPVDSVPVEFTEAVLVVDGNRFPVPLSGATAPAVEGKAAQIVAEAKALPVPGPAARLVAAARTPLPPLEVKMIQNHPGSLEERREKIQRAADSLFAAKNRHHRGDEPMASCNAYVEATFDTHVIVTVDTYDKADDRQGPTTYTVPYSLNGEGEVELGEPAQVTLDVVAVPDGDDTEGPSEADMARFYLPATDMLEQAAVALSFAPEVKGHAPEGLVNSVLRVLDTLAVKNMEVTIDRDDEDPDDDWSDEDLDDLDDEDSDPVGQALDAAADADTLDADDPDGLDDEVVVDAPAEGDPLADEPGHADVDDDDDETVTLTPEELEADMASLRSTP